MDGSPEPDGTQSTAGPPPLEGEDAALAFIGAMFAGAPSARWVGVMRDADDQRGRAFGRGEWRTVGAEWGRRALAAVAVQWAAGANVYISIGLQRRRPPKGKRGSADDVVAVTCLWLELDGADAPARLAALEGAIGRASIVVHSGGGAHAYWLLDRPLTGAAAIRRTLAAWYARVDSIIGRLPGEAARAPSAILRVPGTWNRKPEYGAPRPVRLLRLDDRQRYSVAALAPPALVAAADAAAPARRVLPGALEPVAAPGESGPLTGYGRRALELERAALAACTEGRRGAGLRAAYVVGRRAAAHGLEAGDVERELFAALEANGYVRKAGAAAALRTIRDGWRAGLANPSDSGTGGADAAAFLEHAAAVELWAAGAYAAVRTLPPPQRPATADVVGELAAAALAAGPGCNVDGRPVVGMSRNRGAIGSGRVPETCRVGLARLSALEVVAKHSAGGLAGYDAGAKLAKKRANLWMLLPFAGADDAAAALPLAGAPLRDPLVARFGKIAAAILRYILNAGAPLTVPELAAAVECSRPAADKHARRLAAAGMLEGAGERRNRSGGPSPLYVAAVGSEAEAIALCGAEDAQAFLADRRAVVWADNGALANKRAAAMFGPNEERRAERLAADKAERDRRTADRADRQRRDIAAALEDARRRTAERRAAELDDERRPLVAADLDADAPTTAPDVAAGAAAVGG